MANRRSAQKDLDPTSGPRPSRPHMPGYGMPSDSKGLLLWSHVQARMAAAMHYWVSTVDAGGHPHSTPVDGLWLDDRLYFGGNTTTRRYRNLTANPAVCVHLESALDVVILQGEAHELKSPDRELTLRLAAASKTKYGYSPGPDAYSQPGVHVFEARKVLAWTTFPTDATRWRF